MRSRTLFVSILVFTCIIAYRLFDQDKETIYTAHRQDLRRSFSQVSIEGLPNCYQVAEGIYSGGQPESGIGFENLFELGVKTIVSVDGAQPDLESASQFGIRYVHLPHSYDGVDRERAALLSKAIGELDGPFYIHCHHGKHRSPAATAVACIGLGILNHKQGMQLLKDAGTSKEYKGLYNSVANAIKFGQKELEHLAADFPEQEPGSPLVESMVKIEKHFDSVNRLAENGWDSPPKHPDMDAAHETLLLFEQFAELMRSEIGKPRKYRELLLHSKELARRLREVISESENSGAHGQSDAERLVLEIKNDCRSCHRKFRD